jgi:hypothetical protein
VKKEEKNFLPPLVNKIRKEVYEWRKAGYQIYTYF